MARIAVLLCLLIVPRAYAQVNPDPFPIRGGQQVYPGAQFSLSPAGLALQELAIQKVEDGAAPPAHAMPPKHKPLILVKVRVMTCAHFLIQLLIENLGFQLARLAWPVEANSLGARLPKALWGRCSL